jgi:hypothetical protein
METSLRSELRMISPEKFCLFFRGISLGFWLVPVQIVK